MSDQPRDPDRRRLLTGAALGAGAIGAGAIGGVAGAVVGGRADRRALTVDVACIGTEWREAVTRDPVDDGDFRAAFVVEGWIYPAGTVVDTGFVPVEDGSIGRWFCRGWTILHGGRPEPHVLSEHQYHLGPISESSLFPTDLLVSNGLEGTVTEQVSTRAVTGGTGEWLGATGAVRQVPRGVNTTALYGTPDPAPNFTFEFDLLLPMF